MNDEGNKSPAGRDCEFRQNTTRHTRTHICAKNEPPTEQLPPGSQPAADLGDKELVVLHVLEHLYAHDAVEGLLVFVPEVELVDVAGDHAHVAEPSLLVWTRIVCR